MPDTPKMPEGHPRFRRDAVLKIVEFKACECAGQDMGGWLPIEELTGSRRDDCANAAYRHFSQLAIRVCPPGEINANFNNALAWLAWAEEGGE